MAGKRDAIVIDTAKRLWDGDIPKSASRDFRAIVSRSADGMVILNREGYILYANPAAETLFNMQQAELAGSSLGFPINLDEPVELQILRKFKDTVMVEMRVVEVTWAGQPSYLLSFRDLTDRKLAEYAINQAWDKLEELVEERTCELAEANERLEHEIAERRQAEEELNRVFNFSMDLLCVVGFDGFVFKRVSPSFTSVLGWGEEELVNRPITDFIHPDDRLPTSRKAKMQESGALAVNFENRYQCKDGSYRRISWNSFPVVDERVIICVGRDITDTKRAEEALAAANRQFQGIIDNTPDIVYVFDLEERFVMANRAVAELLGSTPERMIGKRRHEFMPKEDADWHEANDRQAIEAGRALEFEEYSQLNGRSITWLTKKFPLRDTQGRIYAVAGISADISERKRAEEALRKMQEGLEVIVEQRTTALRESEEKFRGLVESITDVVWETGVDGRCTYISPNVGDMLGYEAGEVLSKSPLDFMTPEDAGRIAEFIAQISAGHQPFELLEYTVIRKDGSKVVLETSGTPVFDLDGNFKGYRGVNRDITERKRAEEALRISADNLARAEKLADLGYWDWDITTNNVKWSDGHFRIFGYPIAHGTETYEMFRARVHPDDIDALEKILREGREKDTGFNWDYRLLWPDGSIRYIHAEADRPVKDDLGRPVRWFGIVQDVTERKRAEEKVRENNRFTSVLLGNLPGMVFRCRYDENWTMEFLSPGCQELTGYKVQDLFNNSKIAYAQLIHPDDRERVSNEVREAFRYKLPFVTNYRITTADGEVKWVWTQGRRLFSKGKEIIQGYAFDITDTKRAEEALRKSEVSLARAQQIAHIGSWEWDFVNNVDGWSGETYRIFGVMPEEFGGNFEAFIERVHPDDRDRVREIEEKAIREKVPYSYDYRIILPDGTIRHVHNMLEVVTDDRDNAVKLQGTVQDITERKRAEKELEDAKQQAELYLDLMGHDINNMNMIATGYLEIVKSAIDNEGKLDSANVDYLNSALASINNSSRLIGNVRKLQRGRMGEYRPEVYDLGMLVGEVCEQFRSAPDRDVSISCSTVKGVRVQANELLRDVFVNIIGNAIKHSMGSAFVNIWMNPEMKDGRRYCAVSVEDNGPGIPDVLKDVIFDRFHRGDTKAHGSGLGLYLVKTLVDGYGGKVWVEDRVKGDYTKGARFVVLLPAIDN